MYERSDAQKRMNLVGTQRVLLLDRIYYCKVKSEYIKHMKTNFKNSKIKMPDREQNDNNKKN